VPIYRGPFVQWLDPPRVAIAVVDSVVDFAVVDFAVVAVALQ
jgi:hypothetical protein